MEERPLPRGSNLQILLIDNIGPMPLVSATQGLIKLDVLHAHLILQPYCVPLSNPGIEVSDR